jgi:hypothetical protein
MTFPEEELTDVAEEATGEVAISPHNSLAADAQIGPQVAHAVRRAGDLC